MKVLKRSLVLLLALLTMLSLMSWTASAQDTGDDAGTESTGAADQQEMEETVDLGLSDERMAELASGDPMYESGMSQAAATEADDEYGISTMSVKSTGEICSYGMDVSLYQGKIDWTRVAKAGVSFAMIRVGYRNYNTGVLTLDDYAITNIEGALANGINVGCYFYSTSISEAEAREEAAFVVSVIKNYNITYPIAYDHEGYEDPSRRNYDIGDGANDRRTAMSIAFNDYLEEHGYQGMQYGSSSRLGNDYRWNTTTLEKKYQVWVARYVTMYTDSSGNNIQYPDYQSLVSDGRTLLYSGAYRFWQFTSQGRIDGISVNVDLDLEYYTTGETESGKTGNSTDFANPAGQTGDVVEMNYDGEDGWWYVIDGNVQTGYTGVAGHSNAYGWWYIKNGKVDFSYTGFARNYYGWWYVEKGKVIFSQNSVIQGTVNGSDGWYEVVGGKVQRDHTGVSNVCNDYGWWYVKNGKVDFSKNSVEQNNYGWWYVNDGQVNFNYTGVGNYCNDYGWWYIKDGKVDFSYDGFAQNNYGWWYVEGGKVIFAENSVVEGSVNGLDGWYEVVGGQVQLNHTGVTNVCNETGWYYVKNGMVDFTKNSVEQNDYGWWYVENGMVNFSYTGWASNSYGNWYCVNGKVDFSRS